LAHSSPFCHGILIKSLSQHMSHCKCDHVSTCPSLHWAVRQLTVTLDPYAPQAGTEENKVPGCSADCALMLLPLLCPLCPAIPPGLCSGLAKISSLEILYELGQHLSYNMQKVKTIKLSKPYYTIWISY
jgi:hypothetical protein